MGDCMSKSSELMLFWRKYLVNSREVPPFNTNKGFWFHYPEAFKKCLVLKIPDAQVWAGKTVTLYQAQQHHPRRNACLYGNIQLLPHILWYDPHPIR